jgi:UMP-CMP kinase
MEKKGWSSKKFLIDGFPRNQDNYDVWNKEMGEITEVPMILFFEVNEDELISRV